jgi:hypothetical protein
MKFLMLMWSEVDAASGDASDLEAWVAFEREAREAGVFVDSGAFRPARSDARIVRTAISGHERSAAVERRTSTDGAAQIEAYYLMRCPDLDTALDWAHRLPTYGQVEVRELLEFEGAGD